MRLITKVFNFIILTCNKYKIDDSHGLSHSMNVLNFAHDIYKNELVNYPFIKDHRKVIYMSSALHDICDKKYMNEKDIDILTGWNIFGFDLEYIYKRATMVGCGIDFYQLGKLKDTECHLVMKKLRKINVYEKY